MSIHKNLEPGAPMEGDGIPLCIPEIRGNEWQYIKECLDTGWVSSVGSYVDRFETELAQRVGTRFAIATTNGTSALHVALIVAGIKPEDEVITSTLTFISPANTIRYIGAWPVFIDADPVYWQMDIQKLTDFLEKECTYTHGILQNKKTGRRVKAIMPIHILGHPVDMDPLIEIARKFGLMVIEDATESLGADYKGKSVGNLGDIACFSFNGNKIITTGGGGMIVTNREDWANKCKYLTKQAKDDPLEFVHKEIGYNYRLSNISAAMGVAQLEQLDSYIEKKREIAKRYSKAFKEVNGIQPMQVAEWANSIFWMYTVLIDEKEYGMDSRQLIHALGEQNIQTRPLWQPMHLSPAMRDCQAYKCEVADVLNRDSISLPCSVGLTSEDQERVIEHLKQ